MGGIPDRLRTALSDHYRIERELGAGGMATVWLAADLRHDRNVAIKVLKPELAAALGAERFVKEIKTTAALSHPNILPLFDSGEAEGFLYYVMPFIEGETIREKLNRETQFGIEEAVRITTEVADALDHAHRHGVIHRDIKPENIVLHDGRPMVMDFGIALAVSAAADGRITETGLSLGTPQYMSPEQATADRTITARSDVYSLASVLYEMVTGEPPHTGTSAQHIILKIIAETPRAASELRRTVPANVTAALAKALERLPADRFDSARAFAEALANPAFGFAARAAASDAGRTKHRVLTRPFIGACVVAAGAIAVAIAGWMRPLQDGRPARYSLGLPPDAALAASNGLRLAISAEGRAIAYVGPGPNPGTTQIWVKRADELQPTRIEGSENGTNPSFSPTGDQVAFVTTSVPRALKTASVRGGPVLTLTDSLVDEGGVSWGDDGYIYYDGHLEGDGVARIRETGGSPEVASVADSTAGEAYHNNPSALPGGRGVLMSVARRPIPSTFEIAVLDLRAHLHKVLVAGIAAAFARSGHLVYVTPAGTLMAAPFDLDHLALTADPVALADGVSVRGVNRTDLAIGHNGALLYTSGATNAGRRELVWVDQEGNVVTVDTAWAAPMYGRPSISPDGRFASITISANTDQVWVKPLDGGPAIRVTDDGATAAWSSDGRSLLFHRGNVLYRAKADGSTPPRLIHTQYGWGVPDVSRDGKWVVYTRQEAVHGFWTDGDSAARVLVDDAATQSLPAISPDGRWLAYQSDETGMAQVYVRPFPETRSARRQVSVGGGRRPRWSRTGRELFFLDANSVMWSVAVPPGASFVPSLPRRLFSAQALLLRDSDGFDVGPDGRFLFTRAVGNTSVQSDELVVVENFIQELKARVPRR